MKLDKTAADILADVGRALTGGADNWQHQLSVEPWILDPSNAASIPLITTAFRAHGLELPRRNVTSFSLHVRTYLLATGRFLAIMPDSTLRFCAKHWSVKVLPIDLGVPPQKVGPRTSPLAMQAKRVHRF